MTLFASLPENAHLSDVFKRFPRGVRPLLELHDALLRDDGALTVAQRELIAAYVSGLNGCDFCYGAHALMARAFGVDADVLESMMNDLDASPVEPAMKPLLVYVRQLTEAPAKMTQTITAAALQAGWSEDALFEAASVCALYNYMNRIVEAAGIIPGEEYAAPDAEALKARRGSTYVGWGERSGLLPP